MAHVQKKEKQKTLVQILDHPLLATFVLKNDKFTYVNKQCVELLEMSESDLLDSYAQDIINLIVDPAQRKAVGENYKARLLGEQPNIRYELQMRNPSGKKFWVDLIIQNIKIDGQPLIHGTLAEITERKQAEMRQDLSLQLLTRLNMSENGDNIIREILFLIKDFMQFEAVGIRLKEKNDYPYYVTIGFPGEFVNAEKYLCTYNESGIPMCDSEGNPILECMCGNIITGRTDPSLPFFTESGSFWTNSTSKLLATTDEKERQSHTRNRCNRQGYESVALIPLKSDDQVIGLLQLNDSRKNMFSEELISFFEKLGNSIGIAIQSKQSEGLLRDSENKLKSIFASLNDLLFILDDKGVFLDFHQPSLKDELIMDYKDYVGKSYKEILPPQIADQFTKAIGELESSNAVQVFDYNLKINGIERWYNAKVTAFKDSQDRLLGIMVVCRDVTNAKMREKILEQQKEKLQLLSDRLTNIQENDRKFIARQLHDVIGQKISLTKIYLEKELIKDPESSEHIHYASQLISETSRDVRDIISSLHSQTLIDLGLVASMNWYIEEYCREAGFECHFEVTNRQLILLMDLSTTQ